MVYSDPWSWLLKKVTEARLLRSRNSATQLGFKLQLVRSQPPPLPAAIIAVLLTALSSFSAMATKVLKEYTLEEVSQVFFWLFDLPAMFGRNNGSIAKKATLWVTILQRFLSTTNTIVSQWIIIDAKVFDVSKFADLHPGGANVLYTNSVGMSQSKLMWLKMMDFAFSWKGRYTGILWPSPPWGPPPTTVQASANWNSSRPRRRIQASTSRRT